MKLLSGTEAQAGICTGTAQKVEQRIADWLQEGYTPCAQYYAAHNGVVFLDGAQGGQNTGIDDTPLTSDSIFPVASITKTFTGALAMMLAEEGLLAPTERVYRHLPEFTGEGKEFVTIAHLLTHTGGLGESRVWRMSPEEIEKTIIPSGFAERYPHLDKWHYAACQTPNVQQPGEEMVYCSFGIGLVGEIMQRITGKRLDVLMRERLFEPLGMTSSFLNVPKEVYPRIVNYPKDAYFGADEGDRSSLSASGGAYSNARDLCVFAQMLLNKGEYNGIRVLSRLSVGAMTRNQIPGAVSHHEGVLFREAGWGFSLMLSLDKFDETGTLRSRETYGHSGAGCSMFIADPVNNMVAALIDITMKHPGDKVYERRFDRFFNMVFSGVL